MEAGDLLWEGNGRVKSPFSESEDRRDEAEKGRGEAEELPSPVGACRPLVADDVGTQGRSVRNRYAGGCDGRYYLRTEWVRARVDERHLRQVDFARLLKVSRAYWSQILNRRRHLTPAMRQALLACPLLAGVPEEQLWER